MTQCYGTATDVTCLLTAVVVDGHAKCYYTRYIDYMPMQSIITIRNYVRIADVPFKNHKVQLE